MFRTCIMGKFNALLSMLDCSDDSCCRCVACLESGSWFCRFGISELGLTHQG